MKPQQSIALTGASGYIGQHLLKQLTDEYHVIALSRHGDSKKNSPQVEWRSCGLFSMSPAEKGSSFPILAKLVRRLPVMVLPKWTRTQTHPIALSDVLLTLKKEYRQRRIKRPCG